MYFAKHHCMPQVTFTEQQVNKHKFKLTTTSHAGYINLLHEYVGQMKVNYYLSVVSTAIRRHHE